MKKTRQRYIIIKLYKTCNKKKILKASKGKIHITEELKRPQIS